MLSTSRNGMVSFNWQKNGLLYFLVLSLLILSGCTGKGDLTFKPASGEDEFAISGKISLPEIVETDLAASIKGSLTTISDFSNLAIHHLATRLVELNEGPYHQGPAEIIRMVASRS